MFPIGFAGQRVDFLDTTAAECFSLTAGSRYGLLAGPLAENIRSERVSQGSRTLLPGALQMRVFSSFTVSFSLSP